LVLVLPLPVLAVDNVPPETLDVKVFPDRYVAAGKPFATLAALEAWAKPILLREVWVDSCGAASAAQAFAAVERLQTTYKGMIRVRSLSVGEATCTSAAKHADVVGGRAIDWTHLATDKMGRSILP
jgi:hypothetical protein